MTVDAGAYRPPFCTQRGVDSTLDDCSVVATIHALATASSGEYVTQADGREMATPQLQRLARQMRASLGPSSTTGGLSETERQRMCREAGFPTPSAIDIAIRPMLTALRDREWAYTVSGNPGHIVGPSPLKRTSVPHEWYIHDARGSKAAWEAWDLERIEVLVYDGMRPAQASMRGEWRPASELKQMAFKEAGELVFVLAYPPGGWTAADKVRRRMNIAMEGVEHEAVKMRTQRNDALKALAACQAGQPADCEPLVAAARAQALVEAEAAVAAVTR